jgi:homocysteine S-methyltransferase
MGVASNPTAVDLALEKDRFQQKLAAGAQYTMTQPIYDLGILERWMKEVAPPIPTLVGILPLRNARHAEFIHNEVPGMQVPEAIRRRMHLASDGPAEGVRIAQEFLKEARGMVQGAYLMPPFNRFEMAIDVVQVL